MNRKTFEKTMQLFAATWPERAPTADTALAYWMALNHVDDKVFQQAARLCLQQCTFYPKPAEILERVETILTEAGALPVDAEQAWAEVQAMMRHYTGPEASSARFFGRAAPPGPAYSNAFIRPVVDEIGGIYMLTESDVVRDLPHRRREFITRYSELRKRALMADSELMGQPLPAPGAAPQLTSGQPADADNPLLMLARQIEDGEL